MTDVNATSPEESAVQMDEFQISSVSSGFFTNRKIAVLVFLVSATLVVLGIFAYTS